jgi:drug/metabolite transporter (DMT)-like permease
MTGHGFLILPFFCALVYAIGALLLKRSMEAGQSPRLAMVACNLALALFSLPLLFWAESPPEGLSIWVWGSAPACSVLFFLGQVCTFRALSGGDVSVATPVFGSKVVITALFGALFLPGGVGADLWVGAVLCTAGVALVGLQPGVRHGKGLRAVGWGLGSAAVFSLTDVIVARAAQPIGFCFFGPWMMVGMAALSVWVVPPRDWGNIFQGAGRGWAWGGAGLIGLQGTFLYASIALSGDPVGVNIVYAVRGLWSVLLVAWIGKWLGNREAGLPRSVLLLRGVGAMLLIGAVWAVLG